MGEEAKPTEEAPALPAVPAVPATEEASEPVKETPVATTPAVTASA